MGQSRAAVAEAMASGRLTELRHRIFFVIGALLVFRVGSFITVPGIDPQTLAQMFQSQRDTILGMFNMFGGGALERLSLFALGIMPYISASIIIQLLTKVHPKLEQLSKEGAAGRRKITQYTRIGTLGLATFQALGVAVALSRQEGLVIIDHNTFYFTTVITLVTGTMFLMWLGEQVTERGIGNGISMIIFAGIVAGLPQALASVMEQGSSGQMSHAFILLLFLLSLAVIAFVIFMERGQRRITVHYAKRQQGRKLMQAQSTHLPLKINMAGVIPPIFASAIILFPATIAGWFGGAADGPGIGWLQDVAAKLSPGQPIYVMLYAAAIIFFCFFYTALMFNPKETADNLKRSGAFIPGIRPGEQTARHIDTILGRLTFVGAVYITAVCLLPEILILNWNVPFYFGGTSLLIIVVVVMDFMSQVQAHMMSHQYEGLMKKANLKGHGRSGLGR
ncbi:MAG: preprotein translocase subunit SecY [Gammaproteobacteria bacterium]|nr:preprotein translocase subunit SecY [Gammaproteobacteria bacterium]MDH5651197.1 preprotein translocase subunit SecY [Gammaproteobacteria bacterium]